MARIRADRLDGFPPRGRNAARGLNTAVKAVRYQIPLQSIATIRRFIAGPNRTPRKRFGQLVELGKQALQGGRQ